MLVSHSCSHYVFYLQKQILTGGASLNVWHANKSQLFYDELLDKPMNMLHWAALQQNLK